MREKRELQCEREEECCKSSEDMGSASQVKAASSQLRLMISEKKEMGAKNAPGAPSSPNSTSAGLLTGVFDVDGRATGRVTRPLFLRINAHSGAIACTDPLRRVGHGDVTPQHCSHFVGAGKVQRFWRGLQDPKAREEHTNNQCPLRP